MKSKKLLSLLTAAALSGGVITTAAVVTPSVVSAAETMADQYQPYFSPTQGHTSSRMSYAYLRSSANLPAGTEFYLQNSADYGVQEGIYYTISGQNIAFTKWSGPGLKPMLATGTTIDVPVTVIYPDNSAEVITATLTLTPPNAEGYEVYYEVLVEQGTTETFTPSGPKLPNGTSVSVINNPDVAALRNSGWEFINGANATLTVSAPADASGSVSLPLRISYPDGTGELTTVHIDVAATNPPQSETYDVVYQATVLTAGDATTITPDTPGLPAGTTITLVEDLYLENLRNTGWVVNVDTQGALGISAPINASGATTVSLLVLYPDGTQELTFAQIDLLAANLADNHDVSYPATIITAGNTTTITPDTTNLPTGTTLELIEDRNLHTAQTAGWTFAIETNGKVTASALETTIGHSVINVLITYPDGTSEVTTFEISAIAKPIVEEPKDEDPVVPGPAPKPGGSSFGSS